MMMLGTYEIIEKIASERKKVLYRAIDPISGEKLLIKVFQDESRHAVDSFVLKNEFDLLCSMHLSGCIHALRIESIDGYLSMIMQDPGGMTLQAYLQYHHLDMKRKLRIASKITSALANIHALNILHKNVNPQNIMVIPGNEDIVFLEFGLSERIGKYRESSFTGIGTPEYISPEQTGRTSRIIDYRSDIYSLGITFYKLFCNRLPYVTEDINGLFYAHMTSVPSAPIFLNPEFPIVLNDIILKMIEKEPDDRYKSCSGLLADLEWAQKNLDGDIQGDFLELGKFDVSQRFTMPVKSYGKTPLIDALEEVKYRVQCGESRLILLEGVKGSGKSYILNELFRKWMDQVGTIILIDLTAKESSNPYHAVRQVLDRFIELLQNGPLDKIEAFKEELLTTAGATMNLLMAVLPNLSKLFSFEKEDLAVDQFEHIPLVEGLLLHVAQLIISFEPPFVLMIDDLSRLDEESARIFRNVLKQRSGRAHLVIGTLRPEADYLSTIQQGAAAEETGSSLEVMKVPEYSGEDIQILIRDVFGLPLKKAAHLSRLIFNKTNGNPYYTMEFIRKCCEENWIFFNSDFGDWDYRGLEIEKFQTTANVADRALEKFGDLSAFELEVLKIAAGMGLEFSLEDLHAVANVSTDLLSEILAKSLEYGLISGRFSASDAEPLHNSELLVFRFSHESVYQYLLEMTDDASRMEISYAYGHQLLEKGSATIEELGHLLGHMNFSAPLLRNSTEKRELARLNLEYAIRLKWIGVLEKALKHTEIGLRLLENEAFQETDSLCFRLYLEQAELAYLNRQFDEAEAYFDALIGNCSIPINQAKAIRIKMVLYINQGKMKETIALAETALRALGVVFDGTPNGINVSRELLKYNVSIFNKNINNLDKLTVSTDTEIYMITQIYMTLISVSYLVGKNLFIYVILRILNMTLKNGLTVHSSYAFSIYGLIAGSALGDYKKGIVYGDLGIRLAERFGNQDMLAKCHFTYGFFLNHWVNHPSGNLPHLTKAIELSYQTGDMVFYSYSVAAYILSLMDAGTPLNSVLSSVDRFFESVQEKHVDDVFNLLVLLRQVIFALRGETDFPYTLDAVDFNELTFQGVLKASSMQSIHAVYLVQKLKLLYLYRQYDHAYRICMELQGYTQELMGLSVYPDYYQYYSLTLLEMGGVAKIKIQTIAGNQRKLARWMRNAPQNFQHRFMTVKGVSQYKRGQLEKAVSSLTAALQSAQKNGFVQDEALINELLGRCYDSANQVMIRRMYIKTAYMLYKQWGAAAKEVHLKECYSDISFEESDESTFSSGDHSLKSVGETASKQIDMLSVFKSAQTLSSETQPEELLKRLLEIISENAGSQKTIILMKRDILMPVAWSSSEGVTVFEEGGTAPCDYPETIINQVARNLEAVIIEDVSKIAVLRKDPYVMRYSPVSLMCIPILWKNSLSGILYLENNHMSGAFNRGRLEVMQVLTAQFVISYDNALLYDNLRTSEVELKTHKYKLERIVDERTGELSRANFEIQMLLDHAGQGFFSFGPTGRIGSELSRECYRIFQKNICGENISELMGLYSSGDETDLISRIISKAFRVTEIFESKVYLSLLPQELTIRDRIISIEYQMIEDTDSRRVMTILTDVTEPHALMLIREEEKQNLKMIVKVIKNRNSFLRSLEDYTVFTEDGCRKLVNQERDYRDIMAELFRMVHTFKGDFAQWGFRNTESALHEIESLIAYQSGISDSREEVVSFIKELDFDKAIGKDLMILEDAIGKSFLQGDEYYEISRAEIVELELMAESKQTEALSSRIKEMRLLNLKELLSPYNDYVSTLAFGLDKKINPLQIVGEDLRIDRKHYHNLVKVLTHIFRNMMDYGIESPEERLKLSKAESGLITCRITKTSDSWFTLDLEDDGHGIDQDVILQTLLQRDPDKRDFYLQLSREELIQLIFSDGISTSGDITMLSGRGIGLSAVREEVEKLKGEITVYSTPGAGTRFSIHLPIIV